MNAQRNDVVQTIRHTCNRVLIIVRLNGVEVRCEKCGVPRLYTWREILTMMLAAELART